MTIVAKALCPWRRGDRAERRLPLMAFSDLVQFPLLTPLLGQKRTSRICEYAPQSCVSTRPGRAFAGTRRLLSLAEREMRAAKRHDGAEAQRCEARQHARDGRDRARRRGGLSGAGQDQYADHDQELP